MDGYWAVKVALFKLWLTPFLLQYYSRHSRCRFIGEGARDSILLPLTSSDLLSGVRDEACLLYHCLSIAENASSRALRRQRQRTFGTLLSDSLASSQLAAT